MAGATYTELQRLVEKLVSASIHILLSLKRISLRRVGSSNGQYLKDQLVIYTVLVLGVCCLRTQLDGQSFTHRMEVSSAVTMPEGLRFTRWSDHALLRKPKLRLYELQKQSLKIWDCGMSVVTCSRDIKRKPVS